MKPKHLTILLIICILSFYACNDKDDPEMGVDKNEELVDPNYERAAEIAIRLFNCDLGEPPLTPPEPTSGIVLDAATPNLYSIGLKSAEEALQWFDAHCVPSGERDKVFSSLQDEYHIDFGEHGSVTYKVENTASRYGMVSVLLPKLSVRKQFELIPMELWPDNDNSIFYRGDVVRDTQDNQYYFCVRACEGDVGILISFAGKWNATKYNYEDYYDWWKEHFKLPKGISEAAWNAYAQMYYGNEENFRALFNNIKKRVPDVEFFGAPAIFALTDKNNYSSYRYAVGSPWGGRHLWWARKVWKLTQRYVYIGKNELRPLANYWGLVTFRTEDISKVDHDYWQYPSFYPGVHEERFVNTQECRERFALVYEGNI